MRKALAVLASPVRLAIIFLAGFLTLGLLTAHAEQGMAVYYNNTFQGKRTADGGRFDQQGLTAAHKTLPFGTKVKVTNPATKQSVVLTITDRMSRRNRNMIDMTRRAAREIGIEKKGSALVELALVP